MNLIRTLPFFISALQATACPYMQRLRKSDCDKSPKNDARKAKRSLQADGEHITYGRFFSEADVPTFTGSSVAQIIESTKPGVGSYMDEGVRATQFTRPGQDFGFLMDTCNFTYQTFNCSTFGAPFDGEDGRPEILVIDRTVSPFMKCNVISMFSYLSFDLFSCSCCLRFLFISTGPCWVHLPKPAPLA